MIDISRIFKAIEDPFWDRVDKSAGPDECWPCGGVPNNRGYCFYKGNGAHRYSWSIVFGDAGNLHVLHKCDNPPCVNPTHLFIGTHSDNMKDKVAKGRDIALELHPKGEKHGRAKLTWDNITYIRQQASMFGKFHTTLAKEFGVTPTLIDQVIKENIWKEENRPND